MKYLIRAPGHPDSIGDYRDEMECRGVIRRSTLVVDMSTVKVTPLYDRGPETHELSLDRDAVEYLTWLVSTNVAQMAARAKNYDDDMRCAVKFRSDVLARLRSLRGVFTDQASDRTGLLVKLYSVLNQRNGAHMVTDMISELSTGELRSLRSAYREVNDA